MTNMLSWLAEFFDVFRYSWYPDFFPIVLVCLTESEMHKSFPAEVSI